jgi:hypothetical protein
MTTKAKLRKYIMEVAGLDVEFLENELGGTDRMMDAITDYLENCDKEELQRIAEVAKESKYQPKSSDEPENEEMK